jgi:hypothetical protein
MVKKPVGLKTTPAWKQLDHLGGRRVAGGVAVAPWARRSDAASGAARRGVHSRACLEAAHNNYLLLAHVEGEGAGSPVKEGIGAVVEGVERGNHAATPDPDKAGVEEVSWKLAGHLATQIVPKILDIFLKLCPLIHLLLKINLAKQLEQLPGLLALEVMSRQSCSPSPSLPLLF